MPEVVYENVMTLFQPLPARGRIESALFDVSGARAVHLTLGIRAGAGGDPNVFWGVHFGPAQNGTFPQTARGTFAASGTLTAPFPVFGPQMLVIVENRSTRDTTCDGKIYFIREVP